ncbi:ATP-binding protein [Myroides odoratus]|uniref:ATP-binding protein n=1 Tax=Myroides odoratus TaxID=256 RepID=UPI0007661260|nr:ATP-binding protein [Myroides odoratus]
MKYNEIKFIHKKQNKILRKNRKRQKKIYNKNGIKIKRTVNIPVPNIFYMPTNLTIKSNLEGVLRILNRIRKNKRFGRFKGRKYINISYKNVVEVDYGALSLMKSVMDSFGLKHIFIHGDLPENNDVKKIFLSSGFLNNLFDGKGNKFGKISNTDSDMFIFKYGKGELTINDNRLLSEKIKMANKHLTGNYKPFSPLKTILLEICGNSIEHGKTNDRLWFLGLEFKDNEVIFTFTDLGVGILKSLYIKFFQQIKDIFSSRHTVLLNAFNKKYGSSTKEVNRNKGLPGIKSYNEKGLINNLIVITNDAFLDFDEINNCKSFQNDVQFEGTFFQWTLDINCINNISKLEDEFED